MAFSYSGSLLLANFGLFLCFSCSMALLFVANKFSSSSTCDNQSSVAHRMKHAISCLRGII